jgi:hypothetical protein
MTEQIIKTTVEELKGYLKFYAFDCAEPFVKEAKRFTVCDNEEHTPYFQLLKPPEIKTNPYTKKPMEIENIFY